MKKRSIIVTGVLAATIIVSSSIIATHTLAVEEIIVVDKVNYVSLQQMSKKYNYQFKDEGGSYTIIGESINLVVVKGSRQMFMNGNEFYAQVKPVLQSDQVWISSLDWATMFNLALTHFDKVSQVDKVDSLPVTNEATLDPDTYKVPDDWGDKHPRGVRQHGSPINITTPHIEGVIYKTESKNPVMESKVQR